MSSDVDKRQTDFDSKFLLDGEQTDRKIPNPLQLASKCICIVMFTSVFLKCIFKMVLHSTFIQMFPRKNVAPIKPERDRQMI